MAQLVSKNYGKAFFELALESNNLDTYEKEAKIVIEALSSDETFKSIINHPEISQENKFQMLKNIFEGKVSESFFGLFKIVFTKRRETYLCEILKDFLDKVLEHKGIAIAEVVSSVELTEDQLLKIENKLLKNLNKKIILDVKVDSSLIAGLKITVDGHVIDGSVKKQISDIRTTLYNIKMA